MVDGQLQLHRALELMEMLQVTIYEHPRDYPDHFVARVWKIGPSITESGEIRLADTLDEARQSVFALAPHADFCMERSPEDDPTIIETWL